MTQALTANCLPVITVIGVVLHEAHGHVEDVGQERGHFLRAAQDEGLQAWEEGRGWRRETGGGNARYSKGKKKEP